MEREAQSWQSVARERFEALLSELDEMAATERESHAGAAAKSARTRLAEDLNQGLRRLRLAETVFESAALLVELAVPFGARCAVVVFRDGMAEVIAAHRMGVLPIAFAPNTAAAFQTVIESGDPVVALGTAPEMSEQLSERLNQEKEERIHLFPLSVHGVTQGVLAASEATEPAALELLANVAALRWETLTPAAAAQRKDLVMIAGAATTEGAGTSEAAANWADLTPELQALHRRAQRFSRVRVAEMRLAHEAALRRGFERSDIYQAMREPIDRAREEFRREYLSKSPTMVDYLYLGMLRGLADDQEQRFGAAFPGPLK